MNLIKAMKTQVKRALGGQSYLGENYISEEWPALVQSDFDCGVKVKRGCEMAKSRLKQG